MAFKPAFKTLNIMSGEKNSKDLNDEAMINAAPTLKPWMELNSSASILRDNKIIFSDLPSSRWLFNKGLMGTVNELIKVKPDHSVKLNAGYMYQVDEENLQEETNYFLPNDTINILNSQNNKHVAEKCYLEITNTINNKNTFLNNRTTLEGSDLDNNGLTIENNSPFTIYQKFKTFRLSNSLSNIRLIRKSIITDISSYVSYEQNPEQMNITPGVFEDVLNNNKAFIEANQQIQFNRFYTSNSIGIKFIGDHFYQKYNTGFSLLNQSLQTELYPFDQNHYAENVVGDKGNFYYFKPFLFSSWSLHSETHSFTLDVLSSVPFYKYNDLLLSEPLQKRSVQSDPTFSFRTDVGKENTLEINARLDHNNPDIFTVYRGSILENYRTLRIEELPLDNSINKTIGARFDFQKSLKLLFANLGMRYSETNNKWIHKDSISEKVSIIKAIPLANKSQNFSYFTGFSKYFFFIRTNFEFSYNGSLSKKLEYENGALFPVKNTENTFKGRLQKSFSKIAELAYNISFNKVKSKYLYKTETKTNSYNEWNHTISLKITPTDNWLLNFSLDNKTITKNNPISAVFADAKIRYRVEKLRLDINMGIFNITGQQKFNEFYFDQYIFYKTSINLRPRTFYISTYFNF
jgi:hypothetical protein